MRTGAATAASRVPVVCATSGGGGVGLLHAAVDEATISAAAARRFTLHGMAIKDGLLTDFDHEMGTTRRLLNRLPDDKFSWKPHEKSMTLGALATHLANIPYWGDIILNHSSVDLATIPPRREEMTSRAAVLADFDEKVRRTRALLDQTDAQLSSLWTLKRSGQEIFTAPRVAAFRSFVLHHIIHHRGQLSVYLRLNDVPVPAIYGPTADEGG